MSSLGTGCVVPLLITHRAVLFVVFMLRSPTLKIICLTLLTYVYVFEYYDINRDQNKQWTRCPRTSVSDDDISWGWSVIDKARQTQKDTDQFQALKSFINSDVAGIYWRQVTLCWIHSRKQAGRLSAEVVDWGFGSSGRNCRAHKNRFSPQWTKELVSLPHRRTWAIRQRVDDQKGFK